MKYDKNEKKFILDLAKKAIECFLEKGVELEVGESEVQEELKKIGACFVTLTIGGKLRGCIGDIEAYQPLYKDVIKNAIAAGFYDPRFEPLDKDEFEKIEIEISVLEKPKEAKSEEIKRGDGVILERDGRRAVFLPQVWEELPEKRDFLRHLALKAGLFEDDWKEAGYEVFGVEIVKYP